MATETAFFLKLLRDGDHFFLWLFASSPARTMPSSAPCRPGEPFRANSNSFTANLGCFAPAVNPQAARGLE